MSNISYKIFPRSRHVFRYEDNGDTYEIDIDQLCEAYGYITANTHIGAINSLTCAICGRQWTINQSKENHWILNQSEEGLCEHLRADLGIDTGRIFYIDSSGRSGTYKSLSELPPLRDNDQIVILSTGIVCDRQVIEFSRSYSKGWSVPLARPPERLRGQTSVMAILDDDPQQTETEKAQTGSTVRSEPWTREYKKQNPHLFRRRRK